MSDQIDQRVEQPTKTAEKTSDSTQNEVNQGRGDLVDKQKAETERLKAGGKSGITYEIGKPDLFDSVKEAGKAAAADLVPFGDQEVAKKVPHEKQAGGDTQPQGDAPPAAGEKQPEMFEKQAGPGKHIDKNDSLDVSHDKEAGVTRTGLPDGTTMVEDKNGNKVVYLPDGQSVRYNAADGSVTHTMKDGSEVTTPKGGGPVHVVDENGTQTVVKPDGEVVVVTQKGERVEMKPDNSMVHYDRSGNESETVKVDENGSVWKTKPDGSWSEKKPDGTETEFNKADGKTTVSLPDHTKITHSPDGGTVVELPDGQQTIRYNPDHSVTAETRYKDGSASSTTVPDGGAHLVTKEGTQVMVSSDGNVIVLDKNGNRTEYHSDGNILRRFDPGAKEIP